MAEEIKEIHSQIETHPEHLSKFRRLLVALYSQTQKVYFNRCELAYDFPYPMSNLFIASNTGRNMNVYEGTRYFGRKDESKVHAFCRNYDKKTELKSKGIEVVGERTRVELVYRPDEKIPLENIIQYPLKFNDCYTCSITDLQAVRAEKRAMILGYPVPNDFNIYPITHITHVISGLRFRHLVYTHTRYRRSYRALQQWQSNN